MSKFAFLLFLRTFPLILRPLAILLEGFLLANETLLVATLPVAMIVLASTSFPVHVKMLKLKPTDRKFLKAKQTYLGAVIFLSLMALPAIAAVDQFVFQIGISITFLFFLIEKVADETSRLLEFEKRFRAWFLVQVLRSSWPVLAIGAAVSGLSYYDAFLFSGILMFGLLSAWLGTMIKVWPDISMRSLALIWDRGPYTVGALLPAVFRNVPRIFVVRVFPEIAHLYVAIAQATQSISILVDVKFTMPYRKIIAQRPSLYTLRIAKPTIIGILVCLAGAILCRLVELTSLQELMIPVMLAGSLLFECAIFAITTLKIGIVSWYMRPASALMSYIACFAVYPIFVLALWLIDYRWGLTIFDIPMMSAMLGIAWFFILTAMIEKEGKV